jgi:hypothetical protein
MTVKHLLLLCLVLVVLLLPFIPALSEWLWPTDFAPLPMRSDQPNSLAFFAHSFRRALIERHGLNLDAMQQAGENYEIAASKDLSAGRDIRKTQEERPRDLFRALGRTNHIVVFPSRAWLPQKSRIRSDLYAAQDIESGDGVRLRSCLAEGDVLLGENTTVQRWVHGRHVRLLAHVHVEGRATAQETVSFTPPARFERAGAPTVEFGNVSRTSTPVNMPSPVASRQVLEGKAEIGPDHQLASDYVVRGDCQVATHLILDGSIKSHGTMHIGAGTRIIGGLSARKNMGIGANSSILGPLIGFEDIVLGPNCRIGRPDAPTTLVCNRLFVSPGCIMHGVITTYDGGYVMLEEEDHAES